MTGYDRYAYLYNIYNSYTSQYAWWPNLCPLLVTSTANTGKLCYGQMVFKSQTKIFIYATGQTINCNCKHTYRVNCQHIQTSSDHHIIKKLQASQLTPLDYCSQQLNKSPPRYKHNTYTHWVSIFSPQASASTFLVVRDQVVYLSQSASGIKLVTRLTTITR